MISLDEQVTWWNENNPLTKKNGVLIDAESENEKLILDVCAVHVTFNLIVYKLKQFIYHLLKYVSLLMIALN